MPEVLGCGKVLLLCCDGVFQRHTSFQIILAATLDAHVAFFQWQFAVRYHGDEFLLRTFVHEIWLCYDTYKHQQ